MNSGQPLKEWLLPRVPEAVRDTMIRVSRTALVFVGFLALTSLEHITTPGNKPVIVDDPLASTD